VPSAIESAFALAGVNRYVSAGYDFQKLNLAVPALSEAQIAAKFCAIAFSNKVGNRRIFQNSYQCTILSNRLFK
jgi:hypothetical protein